MEAHSPAWSRITSEGSGAIDELLSLRHAGCWKDHVGARALPRSSSDRSATRGHLPVSPGRSPALQTSTGGSETRGLGGRRRNPTTANVAQRNPRLDRGAATPVRSPRIKRPQVAPGRRESSRRQSLAEDPLAPLALRSRERLLPGRGASLRQPSSYLERTVEAGSTRGLCAALPQGGDSGRGVGQEPSGLCPFPLGRLTLPRSGVECRRTRA